MGSLDWHEKLVRKISERNINLTILGKALAWFALGSIFSIELVRWGYIILIASVYLIFRHIIKSFMQYLYGYKINYLNQMLGISGLLLLILFLGIQTPQMPFKIYVFIFGVILAIPALFNLIANGKKTKKRSK